MARYQWPAGNGEAPTIHPVGRGLLSEQCPAPLHIPLVSDTQPRQPHQLGKRRVRQAHEILGFLPLVSKKLISTIERVGVMRVLILISILMIGACGMQPPREALPTTWARADGQPINSGLLDIDSLACKDEMQSPDEASRNTADKGNYNRAMVDFVSCMRGHGYVLFKS